MAAAEQDPANSRRHPKRIKNARQLASAGFIDHAVKEYVAGKAPDLAAGLLAEQGRIADAIHLLEKHPGRDCRIQAAAYRKRTGDEAGAARALTALGTLTDEESARYSELSMAERPRSGSMRRPARITPRYDEKVTPARGESPAVRKDAVRKEPVRKEAVRREPVRKEPARKEAVREEAVQVELHTEGSPEAELERLRNEAERRAAEVTEARRRARERAAELARAREVAKRAEQAGGLELELDSDLELDVEVEEPRSSEEDFYEHGTTLPRMPAAREEAPAKATTSSSDSATRRPRPNGLRRPSKPMEAVSEMPSRRSGMVPRVTTKESEPPNEARITQSLAQLIASGRMDAAAKVAQAAGRHAAAVAWFEQVGDAIGAAESLAALGLHDQALEALGGFERADARYRAACRVVASSSAAIGRLDDMHLAQLGPYIDSGPRSDQEIGSFLDLAELLWGRGDRKRAQRCVHGALRMNPQHEAAELMQLTWAAEIAREKKKLLDPPER